MSGGFSPFAGGVAGGKLREASSRAKVQIAIEDTLDEGLPRAYTKLLQQKAAILFEHVYESYQGEGRSVYNRVA
jgi:type I restriction enzyme, R subunit